MAVTEAPELLLTFEPSAALADKERKPGAFFSVLSELFG
jgi:ABC-type uncharacterized transport system ATPase subunit